MNRRSKASRRPRGNSSNPHQPSPSDRPSQPSSSGRPPRLLPPWIEKSWTAAEVWALMSQTERSWSESKFSDTPEYWTGIAPSFPGSTAANLRNIHLAIVKFQRTVGMWKKDEIQKLIASVYENLKDAMDTPDWWGRVATRLSGRTALDCRIAYNTFGSAAQREEAKQGPVPSSASEGEKKKPQQEQGSSSGRSDSVVALENWTLEDYIFLMKVLSRNLNVDTGDAGAMESIAALMVGKTGEEVRHLILKWRPQLLAALEKADRITGSSSGTKDDIGTTDLLIQN